ncbi:MAG TPA: DinB family protein, partial [Rhodothermales bacterium]
HRPEADEYAPFYHKYVSRVPDGDIVELLASQIEETTGLLSRVTDEQAAYRYAPGKWSVREVVGHMTDTERVMAYRAMCVARGEKAPLPRFDEDAYVANADFDSRSMAELIEDFRTARRNSIRLLAPISDETSVRRGTASENPVTVRALAYIIAGHELHHRGLLQERYAVR